MTLRIVGLIVNGASVDEVCRSFPDLSRAQVYECLAYYEDYRTQIACLGGRTDASRDSVKFLLDHDVPAQIGQLLRYWEHNCCPRWIGPVSTCFITADKNMPFQQNLAGRKTAIVVLSTPQWPVVRLHSERIAVAVIAAAPGGYTEVEIPVETQL